MNTKTTAGFGMLVDFGMIGTIHTRINTCVVLRTGEVATVGKAHSTNSYGIQVALCAFGKILLIKIFRDLCKCMWRFKCSCLGLLVDFTRNDGSLVQIVAMLRVQQAINIRAN